MHDTMSAITYGIQAGRYYNNGQILQLLQKQSITLGQILHLLQVNNTSHGQILHLLEAYYKE